MIEEFWYGRGSNIRLTTDYHHCLKTTLTSVPLLQQLLSVFVSPALFSQPSFFESFHFGDNHNTCFMALCPGLPKWASIRKVKPIWIYWSKKQWVAVASAGPYANLHLAPTDNDASTPTLSFLQAGCPSCHPTNSVKALKAQSRR